MKEYISLKPVHQQEVAGLINAVCKQLNIPCDGMADLRNAYKQRDLINIISTKYAIDGTSVGNSLFDYANAINTIAKHLVSHNILDEDVLTQELEEFLKQYPPLRL